MAEHKSLYQILIVDDEKHIAKLIEGYLKPEKKYDFSSVTNGEACLKYISEQIPDLILLDIQMPGIDGIETLRRIKEYDPRIPVIMISGLGSLEKAVQSMKFGAYDYIEKPFEDRNRLIVTVRNALMISSLQNEINELRQNYEFENIIGQSGAMKEVFKSMEKVINSKVTVLVLGESGTGKELVARAIHYHDKVRANKPFVAVNCSALPETLLESELFGHEKGSFTGAMTRRIGKFEQANNGTLFLDEIGLMSPATQAKVLRVLQEKKFERVGGNDLIDVDVRVISATNTNLEEAIKKNEFREDLFYRLNVFRIRIPPLRDRKEDIPLLAAHFIRKYSQQEEKEIVGVSPEALELLMAYNWPGNVRELENAIERAVVLASTNEIATKDLPTAVRSIGERKIYESDETLATWIEKLEEQALRQALLENEGNISKTAKKLGIGRATIYRKAKKYGLPINK
ncbi:MAG: sigma-54-dependent Fis family transcriptional regulator [Calditrichaeota bacterium]|nr:sigma-54-dependent Fis family transcriptional regulator [Calditrichota bacterium]